MEAMGAQRLTPGESVDAFDEAIDVIRGIWAADERTPLRIDGEHYRLTGAKRGPAPAHDLPIWVGALKPRMLRLIGRKADGWLPSLAYLKPGELRAGMAVIDEAADEAGRDPREIRRLLNIWGQFGHRDGGFLNGPSAQWIEQLLPLALEDGVEHLHPGHGRSRCAAAVRRGGRAGPAGGRRSGASRQRRRTGAATVRAAPRCGPSGGTASTTTPSRRRCGPARSSPATPGYAGRPVHLHPARFARPGAAGADARPRWPTLWPSPGTQPVPLAIRSGGHGISGRSTNDGGIVIDLSKMTAIEVLDESTRRVRIEPGARWSDVAAALAPHGWALSSGDYGGVGVGGLATAGGIGWLVREHGLTIDHLRAVDMVLADGSLVHASEQREFRPVLGCARGRLEPRHRDGLRIRGGRGRRCRVRPIRLRRDRHRRTAGTLGCRGRGGAAGHHQLPDDRPPAARPAADGADDVCGRFRRSGDRGRSPAAVGRGGAAARSGRADPAVRRHHECPAEPAQRPGRPGCPVGFDRAHHPEFAAAAVRLLESGAVYFFQIRSVGGAVADVDPAATAYANRSANFSVTAFGSNRELVNRHWDELYGHFSGLYINFETDLRPERLADAYPPETMRRLRELKSRVDPDNVFRDNFNIAPPVLTGV